MATTINELIVHTKKRIDYHEKRRIEASLRGDITGEIASYSAQNELLEIFGYLNNIKS